MEDVKIIIKKLEKIEREVHSLRTTIKSKQPPLKLSGIWAGLNITEEDIKNAKTSLFKISL